MPTYYGIPTASLESEPWIRLSRLAAPGLTTEELQSLADRYAVTADVYAAAADSWLELALALEAEQAGSPVVVEQASIKSVSQDGISVTYSDVRTAADTTAARINSALAMERQLRKRSKVASPLVATRDRFRRADGYDWDDETFVPVRDL